MKLIALILGLSLEHLASGWLHLRELRWFDAYFDLVLRRTRGVRQTVAGMIVVATVALPLLPVWWASVELQVSALFWDLGYLLFAVVVVFFCLGPRDLGNEVDDYCAALDRGDNESADRVLTELREAHYRRGASQVEAVEEAIFVQASNRIFPVVFWFVALGPVGAWLFRISDLLRKRAVTTADASRSQATVAAAEALHGILAWVPARLAVLGYALGGSFDEAFDVWRNFRPQTSVPFYRSNDQLVALAGRAAMSGFLAQPANSSAAARNSMRLVNRTVLIWVTIIAVMTLFGWAL
jgi:membrane protein required for beta-lactamase induction